jgi:hypothetical protein
MAGTTIPAYGPGSGAEASSTPTTYSTAAPISVIDNIIGTIQRGGGRRRMYRQARTKALNGWSTGGMSFDVSRGSGAWDDSSATPWIGSANDLPSGSISLFRGPANEGGWNETTGGGYGVVKPKKGWWDPYYSKHQLGGLLGHELGHSLGMGHGGAGIMQHQNTRAYVPDATDLAQYNQYYNQY